jgi:hypothetical protein
MREQHYRVSVIHPKIHRVRPCVKFSCGRGNLRTALTRFARSYSFVDEKGTPRDSEVVRLLLVAALLHRAPDRVHTTVQYALAVQKPLLVSAFGRAITSEYATSAGSKIIRGRDRSVERNWGFVVLGKWLRTQLESVSPQYRDDFGRVRDAKLIVDLCTMALQDPALPEIASEYARRTSRLRAGLMRVHGEIRELVAEAVVPAQSRRSA